MAGNYDALSGGDFSTMTAEDLRFTSRSPVVTVLSLSS